MYNLQYIENYITFAKKNTKDMWTELSDPAILQKMGRRMRDYRIRMEMTQGELAELSGVSMGTIVRLEQGCPISTLLLVSILRTMGLLENLEVLLPELSISPIQMRKMQGKQIQRINSDAQSS